MFNVYGLFYNVPFIFCVPSLTHLILISCCAHFAKCQENRIQLGFIFVLRFLVRGLCCGQVVHWISSHTSSVGDVWNIYATFLLKKKLMSASSNGSSCQRRGQLFEYTSLIPVLLHGPGWFLYMFYNIYIYNLAGILLNFCTRFEIIFQLNIIIQFTIKRTLKNIICCLFTLNFCDTVGKRPKRKGYVKGLCNYT